MSKTVFIDLDGTIVFHNYEPLKVKDKFLPGVLSFLKKLKDENFFCILTTNRSKEMAEPVILMLKKEIQFEFDREIFDLPVGVRVLINDNKNEEVRAIAFAVNRNTGLTNLTI